MFSECDVSYDGVVVDGKGGRFEIKCDNVVISVGDKPNNRLATELDGRVPQLFCIGDSSIPDSFAESVAAGYYVAAELL